MDADGACAAATEHRTASPVVKQLVRPQRLFMMKSTYVAITIGFGTPAPI